MKAIVYTEYGGPEKLQLKEVPRPTPGDSEVLVKVHATSINDWDWGMLTSPTLFDRMLSGLKKPKYPILGSDIAGVIESVGKNVTKFKVGDEVYGDLSGKWGGFAEYVCTTEDKLAIKPASMSFEQAASIPQAAMLMVQALIDRGKIKAGQKILINGAGGGVGTFGIQVARHLGISDITAVDSESKLEMLKSLGATHVMDYKKQDFTKNRERYDLVLDVKTNRPVRHYLRALKPGGMYVTVGGAISRLLQSLLLLPFIKLFSNKKVTIVMLKPNKDLLYMNELFEAGKIIPVIDGYFTLEQTADAFRLFEKAEHKGKLVVSISRGNPST